MMNKYLILIFSFVFLITQTGCSETDPIEDPLPDPVGLENDINDFVWKAMNHWYFWQTDVANLADTKNDNTDEYHTFLNSYSDPENLFESLKNKPVDDFSWYIPDVQAQLNQFRGISVTFGINLPRTVVQINQNNDIVIYVTYVAPESPADKAGIKRGDLIYKVDGTTLDTSNYTLINNIFTEASVSLGIGRIENGEFVSNGDDILLNAAEVIENPVHFSSIIEEGDKKIGYLVYNSFGHTYHSELNNIFSIFKSSNIDDLILDLRYNGGGSVLTSAYLASMINGNMVEGTAFASLTFNSKRNNENGLIYPFFNDAALFNKETDEFENSFISISRLTNLPKLYVITSDKTASASEMIINGLRPYMQVITVGTTTVGKNEGSNTLVDAPASASDEIYTNIEGRSTSHTVGLQPITFQIYNSLNQNDYGEGFSPDIEIDEVDFIANILPFGDTNEALLKTCINDIIGISAKSPITKSKWNIFDYDNRSVQKFSEEMYLLPQENLYK